MCETQYFYNNAGTDKESYGFGGTGKKSFGRQFDSYGEPFGMNDTIGCCLDLDNNVIKYLKNGKDLGNAFTLANHVKNSVFYAAVVLKVLFLIHTSD